MTDKSLLQDFITETGEHLEETEHNLLRLEQKPDDTALLNEIFRSIHTIKGSSEYLGLERIAELSHKLENLLDQLRRGELSIDAELIELLIGTNDRLGVLVDELTQHHEEKSSIDDLLERIEGQVGRVAGEQPAADEDATSVDGYDDEYDEELFDIFVEQLKEGLQGLEDDAAQLQSGEAADGVLERCADRLVTLRSSANYMGYDELKGMYGQWLKVSEDAKDQVSGGQQVDLGAFSEQMSANIGKVKALFPKVFPPSQEVATPAEPDQAPISSDKAETSDLLMDFITETGEHLEETENNLLRLEQKPDDTALLNEIFRSIHTIKGSSEYLGLERIAELSHKLENLLDQLRRGELSIDAELIELLIGTNDRLGVLVDELTQHQEEKSSIDDLLERIEGQVGRVAGEQPAADEDATSVDGYDDEYDEELFDIFVEQLKEGLQGLEDDAAQLQSGEAADGVLERCADRLVTLRSSANYMGYDELKGMYGQWLKVSEDAKDQVSSGQQVDLGAFSEQMSANIGKVKALFPKVFPPSQEVATPAEPEQAPISSDKAETSDLLTDFITETGEHLEETEHNLLRLEQQPNDTDVLNEIFRSIHTIKGSSEYLGMERIAELSHKLENMLDMLRRGELGTDADVIELLIESSDRIGNLVEDIERQNNEHAPVGDLIDRIDACVKSKAAAPVEEDAPLDAKFYNDAEGNTYEEVYDQELFAIFMDQLNAGLQVLTHETEQLRSGNAPASILERCVERLTSLRSSANYMDYDDLKHVYENWLEQIETFQAQLAENEKVDLDQLIQEVMSVKIDQVKDFFSGLRSNDEAITEKKAETKAETEPEIQTETKTEKTPVVPEVKPEAPRFDPDAVFDQQEFRVVSLAELDDDPIIEVEGSIATDQKPSDDMLLNQLESAFEANIGNFTAKEDGSLPKDMESSLLSDGQSMQPPPSSPTVVTRDIMDDYVQDDASDDDAKTMVFSGAEAGQKPSKAKTPAPLQSTEPVRSESMESDERRGGGYKIGRRQTDKFRERALKQSIRVDAAKIDILMNQVGELVVSRSGFMQLIQDMRELQFFLKQTQKLDSKEMLWVKEITNRVSDATASFGRVTTELQENVMKVRMLPIAQLFSRYPRLVHDLVKDSQKKVSLEIRGEETELDKMVIEQIADPLVHIIRNAVGHGIEDVAERQQKGKPEEGTLRLEAYHESNYVVIEISDDGRGMDANQIKNSAVKNGFATVEEVESMGEQELLTLIMRPGFSTAKSVTHVSGRGVGMDVVKDNIEKLNGTIDIISAIGAGVTFRVKIPLTLAIIPALLVRVANELFTIPLPSVDETLRIHKSDVSTIEGIEVCYLRDNAVPLIRLSRVFNMEAAGSEQDELFVVIVNTGAKQIGFVVDELKARQEVVIKPLEDYLQERSGFSGATILGDGSISLIIDVPELVQLALGQHAEKVKLTTA